MAYFWFLSETDNYSLNFHWSGRNKKKNTLTSIISKLRLARRSALSTFLRDHEWSSNILDSINALYYLAEIILFVRIET